MKLKTEFLADMEEAYEFWLLKQDPKTIPAMSLERWSTAILSRTVYELIATKRAEDA